MLMVQALYLSTGYSDCEMKGLYNIIFTSKYCSIKNITYKKMIW